jgi:CRISPR-associated exonuclease Cas4
MTGKVVPRGAIYHHTSRRRREVIFHQALRAKVTETVAAIRQMLTDSVMPPPVNDARCKHCSLLESCMPSVTGDRQRSIELKQSLFEIVDS